jgi:flagellar assembly protein FliH
LAKIYRTVRIDGPVVTLGKAEHQLHQKEGQEEEAPVVDVAALLAARVEEAQGQLNAEWEIRLQQERTDLQAEADARLEESETRWRAEMEQIHQQRYEEGHADGVAAKEQEVREAVERLDALHQSLSQERGQVLIEAEIVMVDLALALAQRVTGMQIELDHKVLTRVMRNALEHLSEHSNLVVKVHPEDLQIANKFAAMWVEKVAQEAVLKVEASNHVDRGGCMIEGREENVDARINEQFEVLQEALRAAVYAKKENDNGQ